MRDMDSGTKSQLRRLYNAVRRAVRAPESERQHEFVMLRARLAYTIARHGLRSLDQLEKLLLQVTRKNDQPRLRTVQGSVRGHRRLQRVEGSMSAHTAQTELKLIGKLILEGEMHCETGLHVGAGKGSLEIGGADNPVVKDAFGRPYVPGSSLRGKIRSLLEQIVRPGGPGRTGLSFAAQRAGSAHPPERPSRRRNLPAVRPQSGPHGARAGRDARHARRPRPARLAVFDAPLDPESITAQMRENLDDELTEVKSENAIDRITSQANPRTLERVPAGARFRVRMVMDVLCEEDAPLFLRVLEGLRLLEDDALGGGGSRGSGRVRFANLKLIWRSKEYYATGRGGKRAERRRRSGRAASAGDRVGRRLHSGMNPGWSSNCGRRARGASGPIPARATASTRSITATRSTRRSPARCSRSGLLEEWLDATARNPGGRCRPVQLAAFRFHGETRFVVPPRTVWPPAASPKVRWKGARFVPLPLVEALLNGRAARGRPLVGRWARANAWCRRPARAVPHRDPRSKRRGRPVGRGRRAACRRLSRISPGRGLWTVIWFCR